MKVDRLEKSGRFAIVDENGQVVDDAHGFGYKSKQTAAKAMWYRFGGGKEKIAAAQRERRRFFQEHPRLDRFLDHCYESWYKELARGEITIDDVIAAVKEEFGIDIPKEYCTGEYD